MNLLFMAGPARSGTTALADYLNLHPEVMLCIERYKWTPPRKVVPELFSFERILDFEEEYEKRNTGRRRRVHEELLARKDPAKLGWIGDKNPDYVRTLGMLAQNNPGASFILLYRPIQEVAESWHAISKDPEDPWLGGKDGLRLGVENWNAAMRGSRNFIRSGLNANVLLVSYHDFFYRNETCLPLVSRFLDLEFDGSVRRLWREASQDFESTRRRKEPLNEEQRSFVEEHADREAEASVLERIGEQRDEFERYSPETARALIHERRRFAIHAAKQRADTEARDRKLRERIRRLQGRLSKERRKTESLEQKTRS